jgi:5-methylthioadenosine/S-adenosylhomocysteine deaminase
MEKSVILFVAVAVLFSGRVNRPSRAYAQTFLPFDPTSGLLLRGTVVTMNGQHTVLDHGNVLVRNDRIIAIWQGELAPAGTPVNDAVIIDLGPTALIFPGMINLHDHPTYDMLRLWPPPSSHTEPALGRPLGTEPYANRYQWNNIQQTSPREYRRLVDSPQIALASAQALNLAPEVVKFAKVKALVGGETTVQGALPSVATDNVLARNAESMNFGRQRIESFVPSIDTLTGASLAGLLGRMQNDQIDAWIVHLAEGVRDGDRRPNDLFSSRNEFATLKSKGLLTDMTTVVHGIALERQDLADMRAARSIRADGTGDGLGAKLVWSPLSNLLLYGHTTNVYEALSAGVLVSLGTDWSVSGSRNLLGELKIADIALRDPGLLGASRGLISDLSLDGKHGEDADDAERALDRLMVDMVIRNPAITLRWQHQVGSIDPGKSADIFVITEPSSTTRSGIPASPYRSLIDATERDVRLVLVGGDPLVGDTDLMERLKPGDHEAITSHCQCYQKAIDVTKTGIPKGAETLAALQQTLGDALAALGGDNPPPSGGPADDSNTYSYLKQHFTLPFPMTDAQFRQLVLVPTAGTVGGKLNLERLTLTPILVDDDEFFFDLLAARMNLATGLIDDPTPPFLLYRSNTNFLLSGRNPFAPEAFEDRWYLLPRASAPGSPIMPMTGQGNVCFASVVLTCSRR